MEWFYIALISPAIWALVNIIDDNLIRGVYKNPFFGAIISGFFALLPLVSLIFIDVTIPSVSVLLLAFLAGFLVVISYLFYFKALMNEVPSVVIALWSFTPAFIPFFSYLFLNEILKPFQYIGFFLILLSSVGISVINVKKFKFSTALLLMFSASLITSIHSMMQKYIFNNIDFWSGFIFISIGMGLASLFLCITFKEGRSFYKEFNSKFKKYIWIFIITEILNIIAVLISNLAISKGPVSLVKVIEGIQPIYVLLFAMLFYPLLPKYFREATGKNKARKIIFMLIMFLGLYFVNK